jgi:phosphate uptake regulator
MNERIRQLAEQADLCFINHEGKLTSHFENFADMDNEVKKFAELIVRECINYCGENLSKTVGGALKIHFGVEE